MSTGWRTALIESKAKLSFDGGRLAVEVEDDKKEIPIQQLRSLILASSQCSMTSALMSKLAEESVSVILCDDKHLPIAEVTPFRQSVFRAGCIMDQSNWIENDKAEVWKEIVRQKIRNQIGVLQIVDKTVPQSMFDNLENILPADQGGREADSAHQYFRCLFGPGFRRHAPDNVNGALNYGYSILLSEFCRIIRSHGYMTELGIHHASRSNPYNLACDLMEPFRPFVDIMVYSHGEGELTREYKHELIGISGQWVSYKGKTWKLSDCVEQFVLDFIKEMKSREGALGEVSLV